MPKVNEAEVMEGARHQQDQPFGGMPDDLARLALIRLMRADVRARGHHRAARDWQRTATVVGAFAAVSASLAAVSYIQNNAALAVGLSIAVAIAVPIQQVIAATSRVVDHRAAGGALERLSDSIERYVQLDLGPPMWRGLHDSLQPSYVKLAALDDAYTDLLADALPITLRMREIEATESRADHLIDYLQMGNVTRPNRTIWT